MSLKLLILAYFRASTLNNVVIKIELSHYDLFSSEKFEIWPTSNCTSQRCHKTRRWLSDSFVYRAAPNRCKHSRMAQSSAWCHWARLYNRRRWWCYRSKRVMQWKLILRLCKKKVNPPGTFLTLHLIISASLSAAAPKLCTNNAAIQKLKLDIGRHTTRCHFEKSSALDDVALLPPGALILLSSMCVQCPSWFSGGREKCIKSFTWNLKWHFSGCALTDANWARLECVACPSSFLNCRGSLRHYLFCWAFVIEKTLLTEHPERMFE